MMIERRLTSRLRRLLTTFPAVALLGARQVGKTTLARMIAADMDSIYLDLESVNAMAKLSDAESYLSEHAQRLVILDEVQRYPDIFKSLRGLIDQGRQQGSRSGRFLLLGSAAPALLRQSSETLAGRIAYLVLNPFDIQEIGAKNIDKLWVRGGFPDSFLAASDTDSFEWRENFLRTYLERDVPQLGQRIDATTMRHFLTMLVHLHGSPMNIASMSRNLGVDNKTVTNYLNLGVDLLLVRRLNPWHRNLGKRLTKRPKFYLRDSGIAHCLLNLATKETLLPHPAIGGSWESFVIENLLNIASNYVETSFYRSATGNEIDLILTFRNRKQWAIEIKRSMSPNVTKGFRIACLDVQVTEKFIVYPGQESFNAADQTRIMSVSDMIARVQQECFAQIPHSSSK